jgi:uncharacterized protein YodC (DUF2158 family)
VSDFQTGSVVRLKSGGPKLTVKSAGDDQVTVDWFEGDKLRTKSLLVGELEFADEQLSYSELAQQMAPLIESAVREAPGYSEADAKSLERIISLLTQGQRGKND